MPTRSRAATLDLDGRNRRLVFHQVPRRRHVHLLVDEDGVIHVRAPWRYRYEDARGLVLEHLEWVRGQLAVAERRRELKPRLVDGATLPCLGDTLTLRIPRRPDTGFSRRPASARARNGLPPVMIRRAAGELEVHTVLPGEEGVRSALEAWYRDEARRTLPPRLRVHAERLGVVPDRIVIRSQRTRWGSCSSRRTISLNWRLLLVPLDLADYILVHELCHLRHMDHSPRFWAMVATQVADPAAQRRRLERLQSTLAL